MTASAEPAPTRPKRRWLQFSLRTMLVLVLLVAVLCGWLRHKVNQSEQERRAVEAILAMGGKVEYEHEKGGQADPPGPAWLRALLGDYFFARVDYVRYPRGVGDESLVHLDRLRHLKTLHLGGTSVTNAGLAHVTNHRELVGLNLRATSVTDAGIAQLECLPNLTWLLLDHTPITDRGVETLLQFDWLEGVGLDGTLVSADGFRKMQTALGLDIFMGPWTPAPSEAERRIAAALERRGASVSLFRERPQAEAEYEALLVAPYWRGDASDVATLTRVEHLSRMSLQGVELNDELIDALRSLDNLKHLWIGDSPVTHAQWVRLTGGESSAVGPGRSNMEGLSNLQGLWLFGVLVTDAELPHIAKWRNLRALGLLTQSPITDAGLAHLETLTKLERLHLCGAAITDAGLNHLAGLKNLTDLSLADTQVTSDGVAYLKKLAKLESLNLSGTRITDAGLVPLEPLQNLECLDLSDTQVTDAGLVHLKGLKKLKVLHLEGIQFGPQGAANRARLEKALPELAIRWQ